MGRYEKPLVCFFLSLVPWEGRWIAYELCLDVHICAHTRTYAHTYTYTCGLNDNVQMNEFICTFCHWARDVIAASQEWCCWELAPQRRYAIFERRALLSNSFYLGNFYISSFVVFCCFGAFDDLKNRVVVARWHHICWRKQIGHFRRKTCMNLFPLIVEMRRRHDDDDDVLSFLRVYNNKNEKESALESKRNRNLFKNDCPALFWLVYFFWVQYIYIYIY